LGKSGTLRAEKAPPRAEPCANLVGQRDCQMNRMPKFKQGDRIVIASGHAGVVCAPEPSDRLPSGYVCVQFDQEPGMRASCRAKL
jgi:hypothetical protein